MWDPALCYHSSESIRADMPLNKPAHKKATYEDLLAVPENLVAEILSGELHTHPRPGPRHSLASTLLTAVIAGHFDRTSNDGPGGWWILDEPECHLDSDVAVPDIAGWRQTTMPELPETAHIEIRPDWVCEVLSPSTAQIDGVIKREIYASHGVHNYWLVDPLERMLEAFTLSNGQWVLSAAIRDNDKAIVPPFEKMPFDLGRLWA